jgi:predicted DNA binding protein
LTFNLPEAKISAHIPETMWVHEVSTNYPETVFRVVSALPGDEQGVGVVEVESGSYEEALEEIPRHETISGMDVLWKNDEEKKALVQIRTDRHLILQRASSSGVPIEMPFEIQDGVGEWELRASHESLSELGSTFDSMGMNYTIEYIRDVEDDGEFLTEKQHEVVEVAQELGYYDTPREASLSEVADELDIAKSTCSEMIHRAEGKVMSRFLE